MSERMPTTGVCARCAVIPRWGGRHLAGGASGGKYFREDEMRAGRPFALSPVRGCLALARRAVEDLLRAAGEDEIGGS